MTVGDWIALAGTIILLGLLARWATLPRPPEDDDLDGGSHGA